MGFAQRFRTSLGSRRRLTHQAAGGALLCALALCSPLPVQAQNNGGGNNGGNNNGGAGITIDAQGVVKTRTVRPVGSGQKKQQQKFVADQLPAEIIHQADRRTISLKGLQKAIKETLDKGEELPLSIRYLGGLQRINYVVFDRPSKDVLLVGPAEGFAPDQFGRMVGLTNGRPPMRLDDLVVAMRAAFNNVNSIGCSIDPTEENMAKFQRYLKMNSSPASTSAVERRYRAMANILGQQEVSLWGVPENSHFALALVEADYRMKRISLGLEPAGVPGVVSQLSLLQPNGNSLQRWWFVPMYEPLETDEEGSVFRLRGQRAKLLAQEEISDATGRRVDASTTRESTQEFARAFSENFEQLANASPPFAELQSLYDLFVASTLIRMEGRQYFEDAGPSSLLNDDRLPVEKFPVPKLIPSDSTYRSAGAGLIIGLVGGVTMAPQTVLQNPSVTDTLSPARFEDAIPAGSWWGDGRQ